MLLEFRDPLTDFDWSTLQAAYESTARRYDPSSPHLSCLDQAPTSEQGLYRLLVERFGNERNGGVDICTYQAMLYWKLYSQPASLVTNCARLETEPLRTDTRAALQDMAGALSTAPLQDRNLSAVLSRIRFFDQFPIHGTKARSALAVRATFLHFCFPEVMPLYDKQVLLAVITNLPKETVEVASHQVDTLQQYVPFAWNLATKYGNRLPVGWPETSLRLVDMALWVHRGKTGS